jgi:diguanylate cyclase (GGDEF)-like protein
VRLRIAAYGRQLEHLSRNSLKVSVLVPMGIPMPPAAPALVEDHSEHRSRAESVEIGGRLTLAAAVATAAYACATWGSPNRATILMLVGLAAVWALAPLVAGAERIVHSPRREHLFLAWSVGTIAVVGALVAADGGARSPLALLFFLPLAFAALSYPLPSVVVIGSLDVLAFVGVGLVVGSAGQADLAFFATCLAIMALLCAWEALDHDRQHAALARVSRADPLTGCLNRRGLEERLGAEIDSATRSLGSFALVVLDLDEFKAVNDSLGHAAGDDLLRWVAGRAGETLRPMDSFGRLGGDEFAVIVPGAGTAEAREVAARVRNALAERVSASIGVATFPADGTDSDALHRHADADLYAAKHGRAREDGVRDLTFASALAHAVDLRMAVPGEEASAVSHYAAVIAERLGFTDSDLAMLRLASILHDVGKVSVPDRILRKPGPLTPDEYEQVKSHPSAGAEIVSHIDGLAPAVAWIRHSHEHVDGSGYPDGLEGDEIPLAARVLLVADAYDSMTSGRPYRAALPSEVALAELQLGAGRQFDPRCVEALAAYVVGHPDEVRDNGPAVRRFPRPYSVPA